MSTRSVLIAEKFTTASASEPLVGRARDAGRRALWLLEAVAPLFPAPEGTCLFGGEIWILRPLPNNTSGASRVPANGSQTDINSLVPATSSRGTQHPFHRFLGIETPSEPTHLFRLPANAQVSQPLPQPSRRGTTSRCQALSGEFLLWSFGLCCG
jgi:hypothetical protein